MPKAIIALGANLGKPAEALKAALADLEKIAGVVVKSVSPFYTTSPVESSGPDYVNAVVLVETTLMPMALLKVCQTIELAHGRVRPQGVINAPRTLDLDVIDYEGVTSDDPVLMLPHPRMHERLFVLVPLADICPGWQMQNGDAIEKTIEIVKKMHPDQKIFTLFPKSMA